MEEQKKQHVVCIKMNANFKKASLKVLFQFLTLCIEKVVLFFGGNELMMMGIDWIIGQIRYPA